MNTAVSVGHPMFVRKLVEMVSMRYLTLKQFVMHETHAAALGMPMSNIEELHLMKCQLMENVHLGGVMRTKLKKLFIDNMLLLDLDH